jgi:hypothetical protein
MFGSIAGHGIADDLGLVFGGVLGVLIASAVTGWIAAAAKWITVEQRTRTITWTAVGSVIASLIATHSLSSPIGPVVSTVLAGFGALYGSKPPSD